MLTPHAVRFNLAPDSRQGVGTLLVDAARIFGRVRLAARRWRLPLPARLSTCLLDCLLAGLTAVGGDAPSRRRGTRSGGRCIFLVLGSCSCLFLTVLSYVSAVSLMSRLVLGRSRLPCTESRSPAPLSPIVSYLQLSYLHPRSPLATNPRLDSRYSNCSYLVYALGLIIPSPPLSHLSDTRTVLCERPRYTLLYCDVCLRAVSSLNE